MPSRLKYRVTSGCSRSSCLNRVIIAGERHNQTGSAYSPRSTGHCLVVKTVLDQQPLECVFAYVVVVPEQIAGPLDGDRLCRGM